MNRGLIAASLTTALCAANAYGQDYPLKVIRIVTGAAGSGTDFVSRQIAPGLAASLGQPVIVENRSLLLNMQYAIKAPPDGYTLIVANVSIWIAPFLLNTPYDIVKDFLPITQVERSPNVLVVHPSLPVKSVKQLIALAKARPGELNHAVATAGGSTHLAAEQFKSMASINIVVVPYKGGGPALDGLLGGEVQMTIDGSQLLPHIASGKLRALAVASAQPSALFPGLPTIAETVPGFESVGLTGIWAVAKTPEAIIHRLNQEVVRVLSKADLKERFLRAGIEPVGNSPAEFAAIIKSDKARAEKVIKDAGIKIN